MNSSHRKDILPKKLTDADCAILKQLSSVIEGIALLFGKYCEVLLFSLDDMEHSIMAIENGHITNRKKGDPMSKRTLSGFIEMRESNKDVAGPFYTKRKNGKTLKSITILIRNPKEVPIGFLAINFDISAPFLEVVSSLLPFFEDNKFLNTPHLTTAKDLFESALNDVIASVHKQTGYSPTQKNKMIVEQLYTRGVFNIKNGIDLTASKMGISRYTVYNYLRQIKTDLGEML